MERGLVSIEEGNTVRNKKGKTGLTNKNRKKKECRKKRKAVLCKGWRGRKLEKEGRWRKDSETIKEETRFTGSRWRKDWARKEEGIIKSRKKREKKVLRETQEEGNGR